MKIQDLRYTRLTETYFEDLPDEERDRLRSQNQAELRQLSKREYPFKLKDGTKVLGPVIRFEPYKSDAGRDETWKDSNQQMVERPNGERAIMFATNLGLITKTPPRKPLNWPGMLGLKEARFSISKWGGGWIDEFGKYHEVDHTVGYHHIDIINDVYLKHHPEELSPEDLENMSEQLFYDARADGWIRIETNERKDFMVDWTRPSRKAMRMLFWLIKNNPDYNEYIVEGPSRFQTFGTKREALQFVGQNTP